MEVETAIARTSRSPMIRDAHDFRAGIHDRSLRKLTGRSYSALVHPIARDFPLETMRPGDVFFHNDVYLSEGGIGHLPDLCVTVPVFPREGDEDRGGGVRAGVRPPRRHRRSGAGLDALARDVSVFEEGLMVPPIRLWDAGVPNEAALKIMTRNSRMPDSLAADLDAECSACLMGARRLGELFDRYGVDTVEACFDAAIDATTETYRREILSKIPEGEYVWEDYAEHDGVDEPRLHTQRITLTQHRTTTAASGSSSTSPARGRRPRDRSTTAATTPTATSSTKWLAPILRNLAETPERMAELDVNEGVLPLLEMRFPEKGTLLTPVFPAPTNARTFVILRLLGVLAGVVAKAVDGRMPADQETIRYTGVYGDDLDGQPYLMREVLGGGSGGRYYADGEDTIHVVPDSRNLPTEFTESRFPFRVEALQLACDSGGPGRYRGGLGYEKHIRMLRDGHFMSIADRSILACWGVRGGLAGQPFSVTIDPGGPGERVGRRPGRRRAGAGRRGDPDPHDGRRRVGRPARAARTTRWSATSAGARCRSPVRCATTASSSPAPTTSPSSTRRRPTPSARTGRSRRTGEEPFFDRGPGYARLAGGGLRPRSTGSEADSGAGVEPEHVRAGRGEVVVPGSTDQRGEPGDGVEVGRRTRDRFEPGRECVVQADEVRAACQPSHARPHVGVTAAGAVVAEQGGAQRLVGVGRGGAGDAGHRGQPGLQQLGRCRVVERRERHRRGGVAHDGAVAVPHLDPAAHLEGDQGTAEGGPADAEVLRPGDARAAAGRQGTGPGRR